MPRIDVAEARARVLAGEAILVDVRPRLLWSALHAVGSISMPLDEVADCIAQLPPEKIAVFYCA